MNKKKTSAADKAFTIFNTIFMVAFVVITLYPVLNTLAISLMMVLTRFAAGYIFFQENLH